MWGPEEKGAFAKNREAANIRTELPQKLGLAMDVASSGSKRNHWQFCLGPSTATAGQTLKLKVSLHFCPSTGCRALQNALRPAVRCRANPSSAKLLSCCAVADS